MNEMHVCMNACVQVCGHELFVCMMRCMIHDARMHVCRYVEMICVTGKSTRDYVVCLIMPKREAIRQLAKELGIEPNGSVSASASDGASQSQSQQSQSLGASSSETEDCSLFANASIVKGVESLVQEVGAACGLAKFEVPRRVHLVHELWAPGNMLTDALKLKRREIALTYAKEIDQLYAEADF